MAREEELLLEVESLRAENERLRRLVSGMSSSDVAALRLHYVYASPLVLVDNLGSTVLETLDPIRADLEFKRIIDAVHNPPPACVIKKTVPAICVASPANMLKLKYRVEEDKAAACVSALHISMHTVDIAGTVRCALEDESGRGYLMHPDEFAASLGSLENVRLVFVNACKSVEIGLAILRASPNVSHVICLAAREPVLEQTALLFASEFYPSLMRMDVKAAFASAVLAVKTSSSLRIAGQHDLFLLLPDEASCHSQPIWTNHLYRDALIKPSKAVKTVPFWIGFVAPDLSIQPEDFIGRQVDVVRLCGLLFSGAGRRVCGITGVSGTGKNIFLAEACKFLASPGGRHFAGGVCVVRLPAMPSMDAAIDTTFLSCLIEGVRQTISSLKNWYDFTPTPLLDDEPLRPRLDSVASSDGLDKPTDDASSELMADAGLLKSYKVFWADTFSSCDELTAFLDSYNLSLPVATCAHLFHELRLNGTQLQDWGSGRLIRVVHVVRLLIKGENGQYLLENRGGHLRMLAKKFDPVTENVLEVATKAVRKELGTHIDSEPVTISKLLLRDRKPLVEINKTSPSYPGLATKYVLYTADVFLAGLPTSVPTFQTFEDTKSHAWEWRNHDSNDLVQLLPATDALLRKSSRNNLGALEMHVTGASSTITVVEEPLHKEFFKLMREWGSLCEQTGRNGFSALALLDAEEYLKHASVRQLLGKALIKHSGLKILFTAIDHTPLFNLTTAAVSYKIIHFPLPSLQPIDSAVLFTRRVHRPLYARDWWVDEDAAPPPFTSMASREGFEDIDESAPLVMSAKSSRGLANLAKLARHPLLAAAGGIAGKIMLIAQHVTMDLNSINELVTRFPSTDF